MIESKFEKRENGLFFKDIDNVFIQNLTIGKRITMAGIINEGFKKASELTLGKELIVSIPLGSRKLRNQEFNNQESPPEEKIKKTWCR